MTLKKEERAKNYPATLIHHAKLGNLTEEMEEVARQEGIPVETVMEELTSGRMVIPSSIFHKITHPKGVGISCSCKINANIGASSLKEDMEFELEKLKVALEYGADTIMDLSSGTNIEKIRKFLLSNCPVPFGTVPIYEATAIAGSIDKLTPDLMIDVIKRHAQQGVDFVTIHSAILLNHIPLTEKRTTGIVSRGGSILAQWMIYNEKENPLYERFDEILDICRKYDMTISIGDGLRPGSIADAGDSAQNAELETMAILAKRCNEAEVQVMIEGPGHVPLNLIEEQVKYQQKLCNGAPFYVLGPIVTDIAPGYDHITSAIGGALAGYYGASLLCYVTPKEHLGLPDIEDVRQGVIASKIAAHSADIAKGRKEARARDDELSRARFDFNWKKMFSLSLDPKRAREYFEESEGTKCDNEQEYCSMCGPKFCAMRLSKTVRESKKVSLKKDK